MPGGIDPNHFPVKPLLTEADEEPEESDEDEYSKFSHNDDLREPHPSYWIYTGAPAGKRDFQRITAKKYLRLRVGENFQLRP